jgi:hypothetical protein
LARALRFLAGKAYRSDKPDAIATVYAIFTTVAVITTPAIYASDASAAFAAVFAVRASAAFKTIRTFATFVGKIASKAKFTILTYKTLSA